MIAVLTAREGGVSRYILYEISLCLRSSKPLLAFVEDTLPDGLVPDRVLQRRFSRRGLLRQVRNHRHAVQIMKTYLGDNPPPRYQPSTRRRACLIVGDEVLPQRSRQELWDLVDSRSYSIQRIDTSNRLPIFDTASQELASSADLAIGFVDNDNPANHLLLGAVRAFLTPAILLTADRAHVFDDHTPREYQPQIVPASDTGKLRSLVGDQIETAEEEYIDLEDQQEVSRYAELLIRQASPSGYYSEDVRPVFVKELVQIAEVNMSKETTNISNTGGVVNYKSTLDHAITSVRGAPSLSEANKSDLETLLAELRDALGDVQEKRPNDAQRVLKSAELVVNEATNEKPNRGFLSVTAEGLKEAAKAVADIAPAVLSVAGKVAEFVAKI